MKQINFIIKEKFKKKRKIPMRHVMKTVWRTIDGMVNEEYLLDEDFENVF